MKWTDDQIEQYNDQGFLLLPGLLSDEVETLNNDVPLLLNGDDEIEGLHRERELGGAIRQVFLAHRSIESFKNIIRHPRILQPVQQILKDDCFIWHSKLNVKDAFEGTVWLWHQDYGYWMWDGVKPNFVSVMIFLDQATLNNGCLMIVSGSHKWGRQEHYADTTTTSYKQWCIDTDTLKNRIREKDIQHITGNPGDVLFFDCNTVHGSGHNMSPLPRKTFIIAYNAISNKPSPVENPRPDWVVSRDFEIVR
jgi:ectoine hydroxylase